MAKEEIESMTFIDLQIDVHSSATRLCIATIKGYFCIEIFIIYFDAIFRACFVTPLGYQSFMTSEYIQQSPQERPSNTQFLQINIFTTANWVLSFIEIN